MCIISRMNMILCVISHLDMLIIMHNFSPGLENVRDFYLDMTVSVIFTWT